MPYFMTGLFMFVFCVTRPTSSRRYYGPESDLRAINETMKQYDVLFHKKNATELFVKFYTKDAVFWIPGGKLFIGGDIITVTKNAFESGGDRFRWASDYAMVNGDMAMVIGHYEDDGKSGEVVLEGKSFTVWRKITNIGEWKIFFDICTKDKDQQ